MDIEDETFTIYLGPKELVKVLAPQLSDQLGNLLEPIKANKEIEIAENIKGRFVGTKGEFSTKAVSKGIVLLRNEGDILNPLITIPEERKQAAWHRANDRLSDLYGEYYGGVDGFPITDG